jgi:hypothetical protein
VSGAQAEPRPMSITVPCRGVTHKHFRRLRPAHSASILI